MALPASPAHAARLSILAVTQGQWGERIADNVARHSPPGWQVERWAAPRALPQLIDDPDDFLPATMPAADLLLALGDTPGLAQLIPEIVRRSGARSVLAPIDRNESLPPGLVAQLRGWLAELGVKVAFPKPFCSLRETTYNQPPIVVSYQDPLIQEFARHFGQPRLSLTISGDRRVQAATVERDSACGCARYVAEKLVGLAVDDAEFESGMLHHHFPCLASMNQDLEYHDTLMHVSGNTLRAVVREQVQAHLAPTAYFRPAGRVDDEPGSGA